MIADVIYGESDWLPWATETMAQHIGEMNINPIIYAELCCRAKNAQELDAILAGLGFQYLELPRQALFQAAQIFIRYCRQGGTRTSPLPDFFIGAHAAVLKIPLLTRDIARYKTYFPSVTLITP
ncbi:MAG: type II toxin-antitoxin system VapC family toxin [Verrucomicrobiota bacterium]